MQADMEQEVGCAVGTGWEKAKQPIPDCIPLQYDAALVLQLAVLSHSPSLKEQLAGDIFDTSSSISAHCSFSSLAANSRVLGEGDHMAEQLV